VDERLAEWRDHALGTPGPRRRIGHEGRTETATRWTRLLPIPW
jgi:hypothetical protein